MDYPQLDVVDCRLLCALKPDYHLGEGKKNFVKDMIMDRTPTPILHYMSNALYYIMIRYE